MTLEKIYKKMRKAGRMTNIWLSTKCSANTFAVLIGIVTENNVAWTVFEGVAVGSETVEAQGTIEAVLTPEIVLAIQDGTALVAVVG